MEGAKETSEVQKRSLNQEPKITSINTSTSTRASTRRVSRNLIKMFVSTRLTTSTMRAMANAADANSKVIMKDAKMKPGTIMDLIISTMIIINNIGASMNTRA